MLRLGPTAEAINEHFILVLSGIKMFRPSVPFTPVNISVNGTFILMNHSAT